MSTNPTARRSQLISTYGVGGLFPAENSSYLVTGLDHWDTDRAPEVSEPRLARSLGVHTLRMPPAGSRRDVPVTRFPRIHVCPDCRRLGHLRDFGTAWNRPNCGLHNPSAPLTPSRLLVACSRGHLGEFPYFRWLHSGNERSGGNADHEMSLRGQGRTSSLADLVLSCNCGVTPVGLDGAFDAGTLPVRCDGGRPWLGPDAVETCFETPRALQRGASSVWLPAVRSAISIPPYSEALARFVDRQWPYLDVPGLSKDDRNITAAALQSRGRFTAAEIVGEVQRRHRDLMRTPDDQAALRRDEYQALLAGQRETKGSDFVCLRTTLPNTALDLLTAVRQVTRLREVRALHGFSRLSAISTPGEPGFCALSRDDVGWLPAIEVRGEGVFLQFDHAALRDWERTDFAEQRRLRLQSASDHADRAAGRPATREIDIVLVLLHTLAHVLIDQLSLDAGYPAASIRERLYVGHDMAGMLLYTATSDAAGSLGGLAARAEPHLLGATITNALHRAAWCSSDPVCIESTGSGTDSLNLAACHACVLIPETSCEEQNLFLDRGLVNLIAKGA